MNSSLFAAFLVSIGAPILAQDLDLPPRSSKAPNGTEFARSIAGLPLEERERKIVAAVEAGNIPGFLRKLVPVMVNDGANQATYYATPDYLAIGSDDDYFLIPLSPNTAQQIADRLKCALPTTKMVDDIYAAATVKLTPSPIPPSPAMTTVPVFVAHNATIGGQRKGAPLGPLVAGHKKDVVIANAVFASSGKVAIYGWHKPGGQPIQPLYVRHVASWVDYSHGIRLVRRAMSVNGAPKTMDEVIADPKLAPLLSNEGVLMRTRYAYAEPSPVALVPGPGEAIDVLGFDPGVRVAINRPEPMSTKPVLLVFYGLPNGNTIEQTVGKAIKPGDDWHFDIQHIGAQTRFLRETIADRSVVVAYLENELRAWPAWRRTYGDARIPEILGAVRARFPGPQTRVVLDGHSGGGSLIFGYVNRVNVIPDEVERIAFLDSNYAYTTELHSEKLSTWLKASHRHFLFVAAYDDAVALLNGKTFVTSSGGSWGRSQLMLHDLERRFTFTQNLTSDPQCHTALGGRVTFLLKQNPDKAILHTVQVERNGFIESLLSGTAQEGVGYTYFGERAYSRFIHGD